MPSPLRKLYTVTVNLNPESDFVLSDDSSGIVLNPISIDLAEGKKTIVYKKLWRGKFKAHLPSDGLSENIMIGTLNESEIKKNDISIKVTGYWRFKIISKPISKIFPIVQRILYDFGWNYSFKISNIICVCEYLKKEVKNNIGKSATVIPIPIFPDDYPKNIRKIDLQHPAVCMIQNHQIKQKSEALLLFSEVIKKLPQVHFYISKGLPENQSNPNSQKVFKALGIFNNVHFVEINAQNRYDYLSASDIYVLATGLDCTPATILEASLAKKPILASAVGGVPEMIVQGKTGWAIDNSNAKEWVTRITELTQGKAKVALMGNAAQKNAIEKYSVEVIAKKIYGIIQP